MIHADIVTSAVFADEDSEGESCGGSMTDQEAENKMMSMLEDGWGSTSSSVMDKNEDDSGSATQSQNLATAANSDSDSSSARDDSDIFDSEELDLVFLAAKRRLLRRVVVAFDAERNYHASVARNYIVEKTSIWNDAKDILKALSDGKSGHREVRFAPNTKLWSAKTRPDIVPSQQPKRKKARIDVTTVTLIASKEYVGHLPLPSQSQDDEQVQPYNDSAWMIQSLQQVSEMAAPTNMIPPEVPTASSDQLETTVDPLLVVAFHVAPVVIPQNGNTMEDALAISDTAKLIAQATPPFLVVYANKAFFVLSHLTSTQVMYQPFQQVIAIDKSVCELLVLTNDNSVGSANGTLCVCDNNHDNASKGLLWQVQARPVANPTGIMPHVLVRVSHDFHEETSRNESLHFAVDTTDASSQKSHSSVGTVG